MPNLLTSLGRWARRHDENYLTEALCYILDYLLRHEPDIGRGLCEWLCFGPQRPYPIFEGHPLLSLQCRYTDGVPDMQINWDDAVVLIEVKRGSGLGVRQLERYRQILSTQKTSIKRLVLLTQFPIHFREDDVRPDESLTWNALARWLRAHTPPTTIAAFLTEELASYLEEHRMSIQHVGPEYTTGIEAFFRLTSMIEKCIASLQIPIYKRPRIGRHYWVCYVGAQDRRPFCVRIKFKHPTELRFEFAQLRCEDAELLANGWQTAKRKPFRIFTLTSSFFEADADTQMGMLGAFIGTAFKAAEAASRRESGDSH